MGETLAQKMLARASGRSAVQPGEIVEAKVDFAMMHDSTGPRRIGKELERLGAGLWDPDKVAVISDHFVAASDSLESEILKYTREWVRRYGVNKFHEREGICHIVPVEKGYVRPGILMVGADSHSSTAGALGCFAIPVGSTDLLGVLVTGKTWIRVPETIRIDWSGTLTDGVMAKDMMLRTIQETRIDGATYMAVEFHGEAIKALPMDERLVLTNMTIEMGAKTGMIEVDEVTLSYLMEKAENPFTSYRADADANYFRRLHFSADELEPMVAMPHSPDNVAAISEVEPLNIDQAYIGACTGAKFHDLEQAARILKGRSVSRETRLLIAPASKEILRRASDSGVLAALIEAGATLLPTGCGACAGLGNGVLAPGERCISSTNRNFPGRMGRDSEVILASPMTVAASAITGRITDPRELL